MPLTRDFFCIDRITTPSGSPIVETKRLSIDDDGFWDLTVIGKRDLQAEINSYKESTSIAEILRRFKYGDVNALNARPTMFVDCSELPKGLLGMQQLLLDTKTAFEELPLATREKFNNNVYQFLAEISNPTGKLDDVSLNLTDESISIIQNMNNNAEINSNSAGSSATEVNNFE